MDVKSTLIGVGLSLAAAGANALTVSDLLADLGTYDSGKSYVSLTDYEWGADTAFATIIMEWAGNSNINTFGIFDTTSNGDSLVINTLEVFTGPESNGSGSKGIEFDTLLGKATANGLSIDTDGTFGFYVGTTSGNFYSDATLNAGGYDYSYIFDTKGLGVGSYDIIVAFEDLPFAVSDQDFNDMVAGIDVMPAPLPAGVLLLGAGAVGLGALRKLGKTSNGQGAPALA